MELPVRQQDDGLPEFNSPTGGLEQQTDLVRADLDRIMSDLPNGFATFDREWRYTYVNNRLLEIFKLSRAEVIGKRAWEVFPHQVSVDFFDLLHRAMTDRVEAQFEYYYDGECWVEHRVSPTADGLAILMADISDRKQAELLRLEQQQLLELTASGAPMAECLAAVCASVSKLNASVRACILLADSQRQTFIDCIAPTFPASWGQGIWGAPINEMAIGTCGTAVYCGRSVTCTDIASDDSWSQPWRDICIAHGVLACHSEPILNAEEVPLGSLMLCFDTAREPTEWECQLADFGTHIASIVFERDRSSLALRESVAEYINLFESIDEGFCVVEMMFDAQEQPVDYRFLQVNPAFSSIAALSIDAVGKTVRELLPDLEQFWVETYGKVALTGESVRFENESALTNCWYDVRASRVGDAANRRVAILFTNITERKQAEKISQLAAKFDSFRITLADALRPLADPVEIQATASRVLGEHLGVNRVAYFEVRGAIYVVERDYLNGATPLVGNYPIDAFGSQVLAAYRNGRVVSESDVATDLGLSPAERAAYAALGLVAYIGVPLVKGGEFVAGLAIHTSTPRVWTPDDIALAEEVAERTWAALERARAEAALRESEAKYRTLFDSIDEGFCIVEMMFDAEEKPVDYRFLQVNPAFFRLTGLPADAIGKTALELVPDLEQFWVETYGNVALTGESVRFDKESEPMNRWFDVYASRIGDAASRRVAIVFNNITERKQAEKISQLAAKFDSFRITLADALRPLADPVEIQATASRVLGEHLDANRVLYFEVRGANYIVERDYVNGATSIVGNYPVDSFGSQVLMALRSGRVVSESDVATLSLSPAEQAAYAAIEIVAYLCVPLVKGGEFVAGLAVHTSIPRVWTPDDIALAEEVAERTWAALERARAEAALRESEAKYRTLFESMDEGYVLMDLIFDAEDRPVDLYYLEVNPAAVGMMGTDPVGLRASEIFVLESQWMETLGRVAKTGIGERHELHYAQLDNWYSFYVFKIGDADSRRVAFIYEDVTERKRREANLAFLTEIQDEFARLVSADEIMQTIGAKIGAYLNVARCMFSEIDQAQDKIVIEYDWHTSDLPELSGVYQLSEYVTEELQQAARARETIVICNTQTDARVDADGHKALNIHAVVSVPCHGGNEWKYLLNVNDSRSRQWREDEIELLSELANRIFPRLDRARAEAVVAANLRDTLLLHNMSTRLVTEDDTQTLYREILVAAILLTGADAGTVQILDVGVGDSLPLGTAYSRNETLRERNDNRSEDLLLISSYGFTRQITEYFYRVNASSHTPCGIALRNGERAFVDFDVPEGEDPDGSMRQLFEAGYRSAQSTPLFSRTGKLLGIISTHWRNRYRQNDRELRSLDLLARQAADAIEQQQTTAALRKSEEQLAIELADTQQLQHISSQLILEDDIHALYEQILAAAIALMGADMGSLQMLDPNTNELRLFAWQGLAPASAEFWEWVRVDSASTCGAVLANGERTIVPDVETCDFMAGTEDLDSYRQSGIRAAQSTPLISRNGRLVGMISTHWREPHQPTSRRLGLLDVLARQVADLLDRKQVEEALQRSEEQSRTILESITDAFLALDENWQYTYVNSTAEELFFRPPGYLVGKNLWSEYPELLGSEFEQLYRRVAAEGVAESLVAFYPDHDRWYEMRVYPVANGITIYCSNVTERHRIELALRESEQRLSIVQLAAKIGAWDWDIPTGTIYWSPQYYTLFGIDPAVTPNYDNWLASILAADRDAAAHSMGEALEQQHIYFNFEFRIAHPTQGIRWIGACGQIFYDADGQPQRVTGIAIDVTDRKQVEIALAERNQQLDSFVYIVSHDLKAPLRAISNLSNWIEEDLVTDLPAITQQQMTQLRGRVQRMEAMIDGLLDYARVGRTDDQMQLVSVAELLAEILDSLAPPSTFEIFIAPDLPTFHTKRLLLSQVFANLISNAFKHHDKSTGFIRISCQEQGDFYEFAIVDDGPGIAQEQHERVFIIFQSANSQKNPDSTGIGLSIVKKIVETAGGQIRLESELGKGTTFYFTWPK